MIKINDSTASSTSYFTLNGIDYPKFTYDVFYTKSTKGDIEASKVNLQVGIKNKYTGDVIVAPTLWTRYTEDNGSTFFTDYDTFMTRLSYYLWFNPAAGGSVALGVQTVDFRSLLTNGTFIGEIAYVRNSEGTAWLPSTLGGTYYPKGWYVWDGSVWVSDRNAIANQLETNLVSISALDTRVTALETSSSLSWISLVTGFSVSPVLNTTISAGRVFTYTYGSTIRYRLVPSPYDATQDAFYANFDGANLTGLIIARNI